MGLTTRILILTEDRATKMVKNVKEKTNKQLLALSDGPIGLTKLVLEERDGDDDKILQRGQHCHHHHYFQEKGRKDRDRFPGMLSRYPRPMYCLKISKFCKSKTQLKPSMRRSAIKIVFQILGTIVFKRWV